MQTLICSRLVRRRTCQLCSIVLGPPHATLGATPRHQCMGMRVPRLVTPVQARTCCRMQGQLQERVSA